MAKVARKVRFDLSRTGDGKDAWAHNEINVNSSEGPDEGGDEDRKSSEESDELTRLSRLSQMDLNVGFPSSYTTQLLKIAAKVAYEKEQEDRQRTWDVLRQSQIYRASLKLKSGAAQITTLLPLPNLVRAILHELQLIWVTMQVAVVLWFTTQVDWNARLRDPLVDLPAYTAQRMPWIPGQYQLHVHLVAILLGMCFVYFPCTVLHFAYVLDDIPDETPLQLAREVLYAQTRRRSVRKSRRWSMDPRFDQFRRPRRRQWATVLVIALWVFFCVLLLRMLIIECNAPIRANVWRRRVSDFLEQLQLNYYGPDTKRTFNENGNEREQLDNIHVIFECCGKEGKRAYKDWYNPQIRKPEETSDLQEQGITNMLLVPHSCCSWSNGQICDHVTGKHPEQLYQRGCVEPIVQLLILRWMRTAWTCLIVVFIFMIPQMVLYLSILQPKESAKQLGRSLLEIYLFFTMWNRMWQETREAAHKKSMAEKEELKKTTHKGHITREPGDITETTIRTWDGADANKEVESAYNTKGLQQDDRNDTEFNYLQNMLTPTAQEPVIHRKNLTMHSSIPSGSSDYSTATGGSHRSRSSSVSSTESESPQESYSKSDPTSTNSANGYSRPSQSETSRTSTYTTSSGISETETTTGTII